MNRFRNHHETPHARVIDTRGPKQLAINDKTRLTTETVQGTALALEGVDNVQ